MTEEDLDLTNTCPLCASPKVSVNRKGQKICRDCGNIAPAGIIIGEGIYSKIKKIFRVNQKNKIKNSKKTKTKNKKKLKKIKSFLMLRNKKKNSKRKKSLKKPKNKGKNKTRKK